MILFIICFETVASNEVVHAIQLQKYSPKKTAEKQFSLSLECFIVILKRLFKIIGFFDGLAFFPHETGCGGEICVRRVWI